MTDFITEEISTCSEDDPLTLIIVDLDYFKSINDILGHDEGDKTLITFSKYLNEVLISKNALAGRWGGDEFVVAGKEKELSDNFKKWLIDSFEKHNDLNYIPQFSIGITKCTSQDKTCKELLIEADSELYKDKAINHKTSNSFVDQLKEIKRQL